MKSTSSFFIFAALFASTCLAGIVVEKTDWLESNLAEATVRILRLCYGNRVTPVGLAGSLAGMIGKTLWSEDASPATLIDGTSRIVTSGPFTRKTRHKLEVFAILASSSSTLKEILERTKASVWWNHMAAFLIIDRSPLNNGCSNAVEMLQTAWETNILNAKLLCHHRSKGRLIYNFNPYTNRAPDPWRLDGTYKDKTNHPWTLFVREYGNDAKLCDQLDFDKTNDLGGYEIRVSISNEDLRPGTVFYADRYKSICIDSHAIELCSILFPALNATPRVNSNGKSTAVVEEVTKGLSDVGLTGQFLPVVWNLTVSYPLAQGEIHSMTQYSGHKCQLCKIMSVIDGASRYGMCIVNFMTVLFFKFIVHKSITMAHLDTLRIICCSPLPKLPKDSPPRFYLTSLFLFGLTINGIFQGKLASLLTDPQPLRNVNTMKDLAELGQTILGPRQYRVFFDDPVFDGRYHASSGRKTCTDSVTGNSTVACIGGLFSLAHESVEFNLHLSRCPIFTSHVVLPIRPDWPLERRFNELLMRSTDAHLKTHLNGLAMGRSARNLRIREHVYEGKGRKQITFEQLRFAFVILGIGLGFATLCFIIEICVARMHFIIEGLGATRLLWR